MQAKTWTLSPAAAAMLTVSVMTGAVLAAAGDDLARQIERGVEAAELQTRVEPEKALGTLATLRRQLAELEQAEPDHPRLPQLQRELGALESKLSKPDAAAVTAAPPADIDERLEQMRNRLQEAESRSVIGDNAAAEKIVEEVERDLTELRETNAQQIPQGHVPVFVLEERIAALKRQLAEKSGG
jgi:hypothetical protein